MNCAYGSIPKLFAGIKTAAVPPKVSQNFLESVLDLKSSREGIDSAPKKARFH